MKCVGIYFALFFWTRIHFPIDLAPIGQCVFFASDLFYRLLSKKIRINAYPCYAIVIKWLGHNIVWPNLAIVLRLLSPEELNQLKNNYHER